MLKRENAREKLIEAGTRLLIENQNQKFSNRMLAKKAKVHHASINYHFGNRKGLNAAIIENALEKWNFYVEQVLKKTALALENASEKNLESITRTFIKDVVEVLINEESSCFLEVLFNSRQEESEQNFKQIFSKVLKPFYLVTNKLVAKSTGKNEDDLDCIILGQIIVAQCMTFFRGRVLFLNYNNIYVEKEKIRPALIHAVSDSVVASLGLGRHVHPSTD